MQGNQYKNQFLATYFTLLKKFKMENLNLNRNGTDFSQINPTNTIIWTVKPGDTSLIEKNLRCKQASFYPTRQHWKHTNQNKGSIVYTF